MAKILVADDNSNIQKMVGLALKDHGIEVVAVGNGEAAVRKISDIRPDLVLADVFMPVRNGYEVCQYVKQDASLAHIPVILLVGAFDPLDEQEAQRVGADGVLKKPFVPPDPLISMVKSALVRAGVAHAGFAPAKPVLEAPVEAPAPAPPVPNFAPKPVANLPGFETESFAEVVPARPAALKIESGQQPVAFGSLLETPGTDTEEELNEVTAVPALERDWHPEEADEEGEEEDAEANPSWRRDAGSEDAEVAASDGAGRDAGSEQSRGHGKKNSIWTPTREKTDLAEPAEVQANALDARSDFRNISAAPFAGEAWAAAIDAGVQNKTAVAEEEHPAPHAADLEALVGHAEPAPHEQSFVSEHRSVPTSSAHEQSFISERAPEPEAAPEPTPEPVEEQATFVSAAIGKPEKPSATPSWFSTPPSPWDAEAQKASKLASIWDMPIVSASVEAPAQAPAPEPADAPNSFAAAPDEIEVLSADTGSALPEAVQTAREEVLHGATQLDMDAIVARVLARMSRDRLQEVARDMLKPVIEAIVREELNKKL